MCAAIPNAASSSARSFPGGNGRGATRIIGPTAGSHGWWLNVLWRQSCESAKDAGYAPIVSGRRIKEFNTRRLLSCLVAPIAAFGMLRGETPALTGSLHLARSGHQATLLTDGRVLVTGGSDEGGKAIGLAEIFNPVTGWWSVAAANLVRRLGHSASLLRDGRVLVVGDLAAKPNRAWEPSSARISLNLNSEERQTYDNHFVMAAKE